MNHSLCPCGSSLTYMDCCQVIHDNPSNAERPEQLMRARYSAHVMDLVDFIVDTYHPDCHAEQERDGIANSTTLNWVKLTVTETHDGSSEDEGFVSFKADYIDGNSLHSLAEKSRFSRREGQWYYVDGDVEPHAAEIKIQRNDACPCHSGKKFKKCCG
ncbi:MULTISPECIES: YchJ family metal-binding protein [unclassified Vibrio]|uniref:YchJ family metal-binding protein n=1 Tax=Vibrio sp. HB236076 TaxID=3232307 RepID=A0AB39HE60_9VIBR|nr:YchJ family metal-binding protein [Vibrio sp. HB161653]MDP5253634.1 YchJ family metal-binding protein [Vibrio sp. HB161653]